MVTDDLTCDVDTRVGASGTMLVALADCVFVKEPLLFRGMMVFDIAENGPAPTPFIAATVKEVVDPGVNPVMVWNVPASTTT